MATLLWIPCATIILTTCIVRALMCTVELCSTVNWCGNGRECHTDPVTCDLECVCTDNVTHEDCRVAEVKLSTNSPVPPSRTGTTIRLGDTTVGDISYSEPSITQNTNCLNNYTHNNQSCLAPCFYGDCVEDNGNTRCECYPGATGILCNTPCCLDCGPHGECKVDLEDNIEYCNCHPNYTGELCLPTTSPVNPGEQVEKETWYLWLVGVCAVVLLTLLLLLIVLPYLMWKHRVILIMKIVHYFQPYEDQDDRIWDAFVSYRSDPVDEEFVLQKLYIKLEKEMGFKLNIHFKDFTVGETIVNNIIHAVQNSRKTILVISKNYAKSEFTRFEYQCAQQEMLQKKHHIIPILLEDITEIKDAIDPTLKVILNSVTYIVWSGEDNPKELQKFWKRLELSMPKRRRVKDEGANVEQEVAVGPECIVMHEIDDNNHRDVMYNTENKLIDEGQQHKVIKKDGTSQVDRNALNKRLSTLLSNCKM